MTFVMLKPYLYPMTTHSHKCKLIETHLEMPMEYALLTFVCAWYFLAALAFIQICTSIDRAFCQRTMTTVKVLGCHRSEHSIETPQLAGAIDRVQPIRLTLSIVFIGVTFFVWSPNAGWFKRQQSVDFQTVVSPLNVLNSYSPPDGEELR
jgi:hypothetical protein